MKREDLVVYLGKKKVWNGEETARAEMCNWAFAHYCEVTNTVAELPFSDDEINKHLSSLTEKEYYIYRKYIRLQDWVTKAWLSMQTYEQNSQCYYFRLLNRINYIKAGEDLHKYLSELPVIVTQKQYDDLSKKKRQLAFQFNGKRKMNAFEIVTMVIEELVIQLNENGSSAIAQFKDSYQEQHITDSYARVQLHALGLSEDITKWNYITSPLILHALALDGDEDDVDAFRSEFPEVIEAAIQDIKENYPNIDLTKLITAPAIDWINFSINWNSLYEINFYNMKKAYGGNDLNLFNGDHRIYNGVAILRESDSTHGVANCIDDKGYYCPPDLPESFTELSIEALFPESDTQKAIATSIEVDRQRMLDSLYVVNGFQKSLDLIVEIHGLEDYEVFNTHAHVLRSLITELNRRFELTYNQVKTSHYVDGERQEKALQALKDYFYRADFEAEVAPEENVKRAREIIKDFSAFSEGTELAELLQKKGYKAKGT